jgi:hypothetical protein
LSARKNVSGCGSASVTAPDQLRDQVRDLPPDEADPQLQRPGSHDAADPTAATWIALKAWPDATCNSPT